MFGTYGDTDITDLTAGKIVFAAPSRPLVMQQIEACHNIVGIPQVCPPFISSVLITIHLPFALHFEKILIEQTVGMDN